MNENYDNEEEKSSLENISETVQKARSRSVHRPHNPIRGKNGLSKIPTKKSPAKNVQALAPKLPQTEKKENGDSGLNLDNAVADVPQKAATVVKVGVSLFSKKTWIILAAGFSVFFFFAIVIFMVFLVENADSFGYNPEASPNVDHHMLYEEIDEVVIEYKNDYGVEIDKYLIIAVMTSYKDNPEYSTETTTDLFEYVEGTDNTIKARAMIEVLAKYQIKTVMACEKDSTTIRKIASNDDVLGITNFWTSEPIREKNYSCSINPNGIKYEISTEQGSLDNDNSGSVFYWNMIDEGFFKEYYPNHFRELAGVSYEEEAAKTLEDIYSRAQTLRESNN